MEDYLSEAYSDVAIRNWAQQIREIKIRELRKLIDTEQKKLNVIEKLKLEKDHALIKKKTIEIILLQQKLDIITK